MSQPDYKKIHSNSMFIFLLSLSLAAAFGLQGWRVLFNNFGVEIINVSGKDVGIIQSVREIPGFLSLLVIYLLFFIKEYRLSALSVMVMGIGVFFTGLFPTVTGFIITTLIMSFGFHYFETTNQSLTLQYFKKNESPYVFGKIRGYTAAVNILVALFILIVSHFLSYTFIYIMIGSIVFLVGLKDLFYSPEHNDLVPQHKKMIFKKKYWLFYALTFLAGARRQIFVVFSLFLLVKKFDFSVQEIALLFVINNVIGYFLNPLIGKSVIRFGERKVLSLEYFSLMIIFLLYAEIDSKWIVGILYILDHIFFNFSLAIRTFFQKYADPEDIAPSMAVGFTINHIAAVVIPVIGGILWIYNYKIPFIGGAFLALFSLILVQFITRQLNMSKKGDS